MAKSEVQVVLLQLPWIVLLLHWQLASAPTAAASAVASEVTTGGGRSWDTRQLTAGGESHVPVAPAPAPGPESGSLYSGNSDQKDTEMSPHHPPASSSPSGSPSPTPPPPPPPPPSPPPPQEPAMCKYEVKTQTGNQWTAGTDSTISVRFYGKARDSIFMVLTHGGLAAGHLDVFQIQERCIPDICKMELYTDASGTLPSWYVEWVALSVSTPTTNNDHDWTVNEWLPAHEWSSAGSLIRDKC